MGFKPIREVLQKESMDDGLRNRLWNALMIYYLNLYPQNTEEKSYFYEYYNSLCDRYFKTPLDMSGWNDNEIYSKIRDYFFDCIWYEVYDFIEFVVAKYPSDTRSNDFVNYSNKVLEEECSAYRLIGGRFMQIVSDEEISAIEEALQVPLKPVKEHLIRSIELFANREKPDYRNSIKESISAVEATCILITGDEKTTLGKALGKLERERKLNPALKSSFSSLYGYTSSDDGIRHALTDESNLDIEDAKFMLVSCSAFINYLVVKASKVGIDLAAPSPE